MVHFTLVISMLRHFFGENGYFWIQTFTRKKNPCMLYTVRFQILSRLSFAIDAKNDTANFDYALTHKKNLGTRFLPYA